MDKVKAIKVLKPLANSFVDYANITMKEEDDDTAEALEMAIEALKAQLSQEGTTFDMISRQAAIDAVEKNACNTQRIMDAVNNLPPAQPEPHEGEWEHVSAQRYFMSASYFYRCSACGVNNVRNTNYCPNCGAKMKGAEHETD